MKTLVSAVMLSMTMMGAAYAAEPSGELDYPPVQQNIGDVTRAQVLAELAAAKAAGQVVFGEIEQPVAVQGSDAVPSRAEVRAEAQAAQDRGDAFGELDYQASYNPTAVSNG